MKRRLGTYMAAVLTAVSARAGATVSVPSAADGALRPDACRAALLGEAGVSLSDGFAGPGCGESWAGAVVAFWNTENLYDTVPSPFGGDEEFTPRGRRRWGAERYGAKLKALADVLDELSADVVALAEVESEAAVRDLAAVLSDDYCYIHRTTDDRRGIDLALLYRGDRFFPSEVRQLRGAGPRQPLYVRGTLVGCRIDLIVCHLPSKLSPRGRRREALEAVARFADSLSRADPQARVVVAGDMNCDPSERDFREAFSGTELHSPLSEAAGSGRRRGKDSAPESAGRAGAARTGGYLSRNWPGSYMYDGRWLLYDNILLCRAFFEGVDRSGECLTGEGEYADSYYGEASVAELRCTEAGVFVRGRMLVRGIPRRSEYGVGAPRRTFSGNAYDGGASDHLPVYVVLETVHKP